MNSILTDLYKHKTLSLEGAENPAESLKKFNAVIQVKERAHEN